jgi:nucleoside-triphosphatase
LVCYGGVSLAIYMHGVTKEIHKLVTASKALETSPAQDPFHVLIEGRPGSGKTTTVRRLVELLGAAGMAVGGFTTEEIRERGRRVGFSVEPIGGRRATLAHVDYTGPPRVGKYGVDLETFEAAALPALDSTDADAVIIDEIGKMELASEGFQQAALRCFESGEPVVATVHTFRHEFSDALKRRSDIDLIQLTNDNRDRLADEIAARLLAVVGS